jgi:hypothetical protein
VVPGWEMLAGGLDDVEALLLGGEWGEGYFGSGGERVLRVVRRREFRFFVAVVNSVIIVLCSILVL